jgi:hypothetical protein
MEDLNMYLKIMKHDIVAKYCVFISHTIIDGMGIVKIVHVSGSIKYAI